MKDRSFALDAMALILIAAVGGYVFRLVLFLVMGV